MGSASANVVRQTSAIVGVTHEDGSFDGIEGGTGESCACTAAERIVHDLTTLSMFSIHSLPFLYTRPFSSPFQLMYSSLAKLTVENGGFIDLSSLTGGSKQDSGRTSS